MAAIDAEPEAISLPAAEEPGAHSIVPAFWDDSWLDVEDLMNENPRPFAEVPDLGPEPTPPPQFPFTKELEAPYAGSAPVSGVEPLTVGVPLHEDPPSIEDAPTEEHAQTSVSAPTSADVPSSVEEVENQLRAGLQQGKKRQKLSRSPVNRTNRPGSTLKALLLAVLILLVLILLGSGALMLLQG